MKVEIKEQEVLDFLKEFLELDKFSEELSKMKGIDWNPFDEDGDEHVGAFQEMHHNFELIWSAAMALTKSVEQIVIGGISLTNQQKHKAVVKALDDLIRLPWYAEPFDGPLLDVLVKISVQYWNAVNWGVQLDKIELRSTESTAEVIEEGLDDTSNNRTDDAASDTGNGDSGSDGDSPAGVHTQDG